MIKQFQMLLTDVSGALAEWEESSPWDDQMWLWFHLISVAGEVLILRTKFSNLEHRIDTKAFPEVEKLGFFSVLPPSS